MPHGGQYTRAAVVVTTTVEQLSRPASGCECCVTIAVDEVNSHRKRRLAMRKEPATRLLHLARQFAPDPAGITLDEIAPRFSVSRRTAERLRDAIAEVFPQLEEIEGAGRGRNSL